ncbi:Spy/CpxP family protein refolding chaperone [Gemmatimonadota bacterium]
MSSSAHSALRLRIQGAVLVTLIFTVGVLAGGAVERIRASREKPMRPFRQMGELPRPFERLGLTDEQRTQITAIFERGRPQTDSVLQELMPHLQAINDSIHAEIRNILTPEQAELLNESFGGPGMWPGGGMDGRRRPPFPLDSPPDGRMRGRRPER